jgi:hypothetical protein
MTTEPKTLAELFAEEEANRMAEAKAEIAAEDAAWLALSDAERASITANREAYWRDIEDACAASDEEE